MVDTSAFYALGLDLATALGVVELPAAVKLVGTGSLSGGLNLDGQVATPGYLDDGPCFRRSVVGLQRRVPSVYRS